jgi:hypothetical protein
MAATHMEILEAQRCLERIKERPGIPSLFKHHCAKFMTI